MACVAVLCYEISGLSCEVYLKSSQVAGARIPDIYGIYERENTLYVFMHTQRQKEKNNMGERKLT